MILLRLNQVTVLADRDDTRPPILDAVQLEVRDGQWISIVGPNGSGKSTLAGVIAGIVAVSAGTIDRAFSSDTPIPYVMQQDGQLFGETPWEDVVFSLETRGVQPDRIADIAAHALKLVGLADQMHTPLTELSGGQLQLAAAAACVAADAPILLFDEAASMLDSASRQQLLESVHSLHSSGKTILWFTHHMEEVTAGDRVIVLRDGRVAFDGTTADYFYTEAEAEDGQSGLSETACERAGYTPPFPIQVARKLMRDGIRFDQPPLTSRQLTGAMKHHVDCS